MFSLSMCFEFLFYKTGTDENLIVMMTNQIFSVGKDQIFICMNHSWWGEIDDGKINAMVGRKMVMNDG